MLKNYDIDKTGLVSTGNFSKIFKMMGINYESKVYYSLLKSFLELRVI